MAKRSQETTSKLMSRIRSTGTRAELALGKAMWKLGLRYRKNYKKLRGKPDFVFVSAKVVVFSDGDFWHGRDFDDRVKKGSFKTNPEYWLKKIPRNMKRDTETNKILKEQGWLVLRYWDSDVLRNPQKIANEVSEIAKARLKEFQNSQGDKNKYSEDI